MQGAEDEAEGSVLTYVTEAEFRKQRRRSPSCNSLHIPAVEDNGVRTSAEVPLK